MPQAFRRSKRRRSRRPPGQSNDCITHYLLFFAIIGAQVERFGSSELAATLGMAFLHASFAIAAAWIFARRIFPHASTLGQAVRAGVIFFAIVAGCGLVLGALSRLTLGPSVFAEGLVLTAAMLVPRADPKHPRYEPDESTALDAPSWVVGILVALLAFAVAFAFTHAPLTLYDSLSYHLFFAARWVQDHALTIIPTPFSDEAQAYAPANGELFFAWLMLPLHSDLLARSGQLPFALLAAATLYLLARRLGASPAHAVYPSAFFLLSRPVLEQAIGANVDLICAAMFLTSVYLGLAAVDSNEARDWALWGLSLGLYWGSKYLALVYTPVVVLMAVIRWPRARMLWALPGVAALAVPWYVRNWAIAGSPIYPASLSIAGLTVARGAFGRQAMLNTVFHTNDVGLLPAILAPAFGPTLFVVWIPVAVVGGVALARRGWWPHGFLFLLPMLMVPLYWFGLPVNVDPRFLMPATGLALLPFAFTFTARRAWNAVVHAAYLAAMLWIVVGVRWTVPAALPWYMSRWLALDGLVKPSFVLAFLGLSSLSAAAWALGPRRMRWAVPFAGCLLAGVTMAIGERLRWCESASCDCLDTTSPNIRAEQLVSWQWLAQHVHHSTVAYTGTNLPYPLTGERLTNRVVYTDIDGRRGWRLHDYDRAYRRGRFEPRPPALATPSGELMPVAQRPGPRDDAARPRYERLEGNREAWVFNVQKLGIDYLFVSVLSAYEIDYQWHNGAGFPIEDEWAAADPRVFRLVYENQRVRIYAIENREARS